MTFSVDFGILYFLVRSVLLFPKKSDGPPGTVRETGWFASGSMYISISVELTGDRTPINKSAGWLAYGSMYISISV